MFNLRFRPTQLAIEQIAKRFPDTLFTNTLYHFNKANIDLENLIHANTAVINA